MAGLNLAETPLSEANADDRYQQAELLGRGGMGEVHLCSDARIGRQVAMKRMRLQPKDVGTDCTTLDQKDSRLDDGASHETVSVESLGRFLREARIQGQLEHPSIVPVYDMGVQADGTPYFTMKQLRGKTLAEIIERQRGGDEEALEHFGPHKLLSDFTDVCLAVEFAHTRGVVHRDLKPDNIMLGDFGEVYVLDWGLAKVLGEPADPMPGTGLLGGSGSASGQTVDGQILGTPGFMSPEQVLGEVEAIDRRSDVYALGAILFELLALEPLHPRDSWEACRKSILDGVDARASERAAERDIAPELDAICVRATAVDPGDRFQTVRDMYDAIERYLEGDRDSARRRELAIAHSKIAATAARDVFAGDDEEDARVRAMREASRALALDPEHAEAAQLLTRLMIEPPKTMPQEVEATVEQLEWETGRVNSRMSAISSVFTALTWPMFLWMGVENRLLFAMGFLILLAWAIPAWYISRIETPRWRVQWFVIAVLCGSLVYLSRIWGPLNVVPTLAGLSIMTTILVSVRSWKVTILAPLLTITGVVVLEQLGVLSRSYRFVDGVMAHVPHMVRFPETATLCLTLFVLWVVIGGTALAAAKSRLDQQKAQRQLSLQAWQLEKLLPTQATSTRG